MRIEVSVEKKWAFAIVASVLVLSGIIGIYAYNVIPGQIPDPGHALLGVQGYFENDASLQDSLGKFCQDDGSNCNLGRSDHITYDTGWFPPDFNTWITLGDKEINYRGVSTQWDFGSNLVIKEEQIFRIRDNVDASKVISARLFINDIDNRYNLNPFSYRSLDCDVIWNYLEGQNSARPLIKCDDPGNWIGDVPNRNLDKFEDQVRLIIEFLDE